MKKQESIRFNSTKCKDWNRSDVAIWLDKIGVGDHKEKLKCLDGSVLLDLKSIKKEEFTNAFNEMGIDNPYHIRSLEYGIKGLDFESAFPERYLSVSVIVDILHFLNLDKVINVDIIKEQCIHQVILTEMSDDELSIFLYKKQMNDLNLLQKCRYETFKIAIYNHIFCNKSTTQMKFMTKKRLINYLQLNGLEKYISNFQKEGINGLFLYVLKNSKSVLKDLLELFQLMRIDDNHYESLLSLIFNLQFYQKEESQYEVMIPNIYDVRIPNIYDVIREYKKLDLPIEKGIAVIKKYAIHGGLYGFLNDDNIGEFGLGTIMKLKLKNSVKKFHKRYSYIKSVRTLYFRMLDLHKNLPDAPPIEIEIGEVNNDVSTNTNKLAENSIDILELVMNCKICFDNIINARLKCDHEFCESCIEKFDNKCPYCRKIFEDYVMIR